MKEVLAKAESKMGKTIARLESDYAAIRAGRANPAVLDKVMVDYYGAPTPVNQLAAVSVAEARVLTIQPWDGSVCRAIERAIQTSDIGINPQSDGKTIRLIFPPLTEEKRKDIVKDVSHMAEEAKIALRSIRRDAMEKLKAMGIGTGLHFRAAHTQKYYRERFPEVSLPNTEWNSARICSLPLFPDMTDDDVTRVISALRQLSGR